MADSIPPISSGFARTERALNRGRSDAALIRSLGGGGAIGPAGQAALLQAAGPAPTAQAVRALEIIQEQLQGADGPELLRRLAPQLADQHAVGALAAGGGPITSGQQANIIAAGFKSLNKGSRVNFLI